MTTPSAGLIAALWFIGMAFFALWVLDIGRPVLAGRLRNVISPGVGDDVGTPAALLTELRLATWRAVRRLGSDEDMSRRLCRAGWRMSVDSLRLLLVGATVGGALLSLGMSVAIKPSGRASSPIPGLLLAAFGAGLGLLIANQIVSRAIAKREQRMAAEFPAIADLLAFAVAAGESAVGALSRVVACSRGELAAELEVALVEVRGGTPIAGALRHLADRVDVVSIHRFVDGVVVALERGTPLAEILRSQSVDARAHGQRLLIESAGRREVFMLMPVVFLILPTVVLVALFPGLQALNMSVP
jgi:tight adherence protein C